MTMDLNTDTTPETLLPPPETPAEGTATWTDVAKASDAQPRRVRDTLKVAITDLAKAKIADDNAADDLAKRQLEEELEGLKEDVKATKSKIDVIDTRMSERHEAVRTGVQSLTGEWLVTQIFEQNEVQYTDPATGLVVHTRAMTNLERQGELPFGHSPTSIHDEEDDSTPFDDEDEVDGEDAEMSSSSDDVPDSEPEEGTEITDPVGVQNGTAAAPKAAVKTRRVRNKKN